MKEAMLVEHDNKVTQLRQKLLNEKEEALDAEREKNQRKLHDQYQRLEEQFNQERLRWKDNVYGEYDRIESLRKRENEALEIQVQQLKSKQGEDVEKVKAAYEQKLKE